MLRRALDQFRRLQSCDEFFGERGSPDSVQSRRLEIPQFFSTGEREGEQLFDVLLDAGSGVPVERCAGLFFIEHPGCVEPEVDADVAVLLEAAIIEAGAKADDSDGGRLEAPGGV